MFFIMKKSTVLQKTISSIGLWIAILMLFPVSVSLAQTTLDFVGEDANGQPVQLDSVRVSNITRGWTEVLPASDLVLTMTNTGIDNLMMRSVLSQNVPNPFDGVTNVTIQLPKSVLVNMTVYTLSGQQVTAFRGKFDAGQHTFRIRLSKPQTYMLRVQSETVNGSIKMVNTGNAGLDRIEIVGEGNQNHDLEKSEKGNTNEMFVIGDSMSFVGYSTIGGVPLTSLPVVLSVESSQTIVLQFTGSGPFVCGTQVFDYDNNVYNTIEIGSQCWLKENLRTTHYADGTSITLGSGGSSTTPYYYDYSVQSVPLTDQGYLYNWPAVMHGDSSSNAIPSGVQGVCPNGWHLPSRAEWDQLASYVGSQSQYVCSGDTNYIAKSLATTYGWSTSSNYSCAPGNNQSLNNATGFSAYPAGYTKGADMRFFSKETYFWSSTKYNDTQAWCRQLAYGYQNFNYFYNACYDGFSVRCLKD